MGRNAAIDWLPHYREVLVANAFRADRETPFAMSAPYPAANGRTWLNVPVGTGAWRAVAVAAGAVVRD